MKERTLKEDGGNNHAEWRLNLVLLTKGEKNSYWLNKVNQYYWLKMQGYPAEDKPTGL